MSESRRSDKPYGKVTVAVLDVVDRGEWSSMAQIARAAGTSREMVRQVLERWRPALYARFRRRKAE